MLTVSIIIFAYLIGSIPFGLIFASWFSKVDLRKYGSGNIGATNALRVGGRKVGILTIVFDTLKGVLAVLLAKEWMPGDLWIIAFAAIMAVLGHIFPVWLRFKGGKGVATTIAVVFTLEYTLGIIGAIAWIVTYLVSKISSLSALIMMVVIMGVSYFIAPFEYIVAINIAGVIVILRHWDNILRLLKGEEGKIKI